MPARPFQNGGNRDCNIDSKRNHSKSDGLEPISSTRNEIRELYYSKSVKKTEPNYPKGYCKGEPHGIATFFVFEDASNLDRSSKHDDGIIQ